MRKTDRRRRPKSAPSQPEVRELAPDKLAAVCGGGDNGSQIDPFTLIN